MFKQISFLAVIYQLIQVQCLGNSNKVKSRLCRSHLETDKTWPLHGINPQFIKRSKDSFGFGKMVEIGRE